MIKKEFISDWTKEKIGLPADAPLTREALEAYQVKKLRETVAMAKKNSTFYGGLFASVDPERDIMSTKDMQKLPFTSPADLLAEEEGLLCVRPGEISRIVTLETSGTQGKPKRVYFTKEDQELTTAYFWIGLHNMADDTDRALILLPCRRPGSVGDLFRIGAERMDVFTIPYGLPGMRELERGNKGNGRGETFKQELEELLKLMAEKDVTFILGIPGQVAALAQLWTEKRAAAQDPLTVERLEKVKASMRTVLLSADYVSAEARNAIETAWECKIFEHYGMTEMGLGGAVSCYVLDGYHYREADLFFEIINPETGELVKDGEYGEIVFTTLTRKGMPFIRYRTGDRSRFLTEPCPCGCILKRLERVGPREK